MPDKAQARWSYLLSPLASTFLLSGSHIVDRRRCTARRCQVFQLRGTGLTAHSNNSRKVPQRSDEVGRTLSDGLVHYTAQPSALEYPWVYP